MSWLLPRSLLASLRGATVARFDLGQYVCVPVGVERGQASHLSTVNYVLFRAFEKGVLAVLVLWGLDIVGTVRLCGTVRSCSQNLARSK